MSTLDEQLKAIEERGKGEKSQLWFILTIGRLLAVIGKLRETIEVYRKQRLVEEDAEFWNTRDDAQLAEILGSSTLEEDLNKGRLGGGE